MIAVTKIAAFTDAQSAGECNVPNVQGDTLMLQIMGTASAMSVQVYGQLDFKSNEWAALNGFNMTTLEVGTSMTSKGIYLIPIEGMERIKIKLVSVAGGKVTVAGRITKGD